MAARKEDSQVVSDAALKLRKVADECPAGDFRERLSGIAQRLERLGGHRYFRTDRGYLDMKRFLDEIDTLRAALEACKEEGPGQTYCNNFLYQMEQVLGHVENLEMR